MKVRDVVGAGGDGLIFLGIASTGSRYLDSAPEPEMRADRERMRIQSLYGDSQRPHRQGQTAYEGMDHLYGLGHLRSASSRARWSPLAASRRRHARAKREKPNGSACRQWDFSSSRARLRLNAARLAEPPRAIFCFKEMAMGVIEMARHGRPVRATVSSGSTHRSRVPRIRR